MTQLRAGRSLSLVPGLTTLYEVVPGEDRKADVCLGDVFPTEMADLIVAAVNGSAESLPEMHQRAAQAVAEISWSASKVAAQAAAAERARIAEMLRTLRPEFTDRHGAFLMPSVTAVLAAAAAEIEGTP